MTGRTSRRFQPFVAFRHFRKLMEDKEDTEQVFHILRALNGNAVERAYRRFRATPFGARVIEERKSAIDFLADQDQLSRLAEESLGHAYHAFMSDEGLTAAGLVTASEMGGEIDETVPEDLQTYMNWSRDLHDLWHVVSGYGREPLGELALLAFTYAQTRGFGLLFIAVMGARRFAQEARGVPVFRTVHEGYRRGRRAQNLLAQDWESLLARPIGEVRAMLGIAAAPVYETGRRILASLAEAEEEATAEREAHGPQASAA